MKKWFNVSRIGNIAEISLFDEIGAYGISLSDFANEFNDVKDASEINIYINSPGGDVTEGLGMYNLLSTCRNKITTINVGMAASIASIVFLAGDKRIAYKNSFYMVHNPWVITAGESSDLRKDADLLDKMKTQLVNIYKQCTDLSEEEIIKMMDDETWMDGNEAMKYGFVTEVEEMKAVACHFNLNDKFTKVPRALQRENISIANISIRDYEDILRDAGFSKSEATQLASNGFPKTDEGEPQKVDAGITLEDFKNAILNSI